MKSDSEALTTWYCRLETEWLPNWRDMPEDLFAWWNLLIVALEDAADD